jgi:hypothetical protein
MVRLWSERVKNEGILKIESAIILAKTEHPFFKIITDSV